MLILTSDKRTKSFRNFRAVMMVFINLFHTKFNLNQIIYEDLKKEREGRQVPPYLYC